MRESESLAGWLMAGGDYMTEQALIRGMDRAHDILGNALAPSLELLARVREEAKRIGVEAGMVQVIEGAKVGWFAEVKTARGTVRCEVGPDGPTWEEAFEELGLLGPA